MTFEQIYETYANEIYRFSYWLCRDKDLAKDIMSETFYKALNNFHRINTSTLKGLLLTTARNVYYDFKKKNKRLVDLDQLADNSVKGPEDSIDSKLYIENIFTLIKSFPEIDRSAFLLRVENNLNYEEIAAVLDISVALAKVKVHRVRKKIISKFIG